MRVADYVMQRLYEEGCRHIFTVTGRGILYLTDALARHADIQPVCVHHEQSASYAALAYSQANGEIGAALVSTGCGSTNAITGVLSAWQDDIPCIIVSGQNKLHETVEYTKLPIRTYGQQEADIISIVKPITKYAVMITDPNDIVFELEKALFYAASGRKGPVWVDIPLDIQTMQVDPDEVKKFIPGVIEFTPAYSDINYAISAINRAQRPVVLVGSGIRSADAVDEVNEFLSKNSLPAVFAGSSPDVLDSEKVLNMGCVGALASSRAANFAVQNSDLLLVLGCRLTTMVTGADFTKFARQAEIIAVDIDEYEHKKFPNKIDKVIMSDAKLFLEAIIEKQIKAVPDKWLEKCKHWKTIFPRCEESFKADDLVDIYHLADTLSENLADESICISDAGLTELIVPTTIDFNRGKRSIHPASQGAMGYALPAAVGAYYASMKQTVVVVGDGSIMMNLQELQTISYNKIPLKIFVINNNCYAVIRKRQQDLFRTRTIGTDIDNGVSCPDFKNVAECFGIKYEKIDSTYGLEEKLQDVLKMDGAVICEVMSKPDQAYIHSSYRRGEKGRFVQPPIEDQSPFLDREIFISEMIIEPIDQ